MTKEQIVDPTTYLKSSQRQELIRPSFQDEFENPWTDRCLRKICSEITAEY